MKVENDVIGVCSTNTYYVINEDTLETIIIDPAGEVEKIEARISRNGYKPVAILLTHGHFDHVFALDDIRKKYGIKAYAGVTERKVLNDPNMNLSGLFIGRAMTWDADEFINDGGTVNLAGFEIKAFEVPGHTIGSMCYYFEKDNTLFTGDTLFCESIGRCDFPGGSESSLIRAINDKLLILPEEVKVYPGHMDSTSIGWEKVHNPFCR